MNIVAHNPFEFLGSNKQDLSRLGNQAQHLSLAKINKAPHGCVILGLADDMGIQNVGGRTGAKLAPVAIREKLYRFTAKEKRRLPLYDLGDLSPAASIAATHSQAMELISAIHHAGHQPIIIGGGHDLAYPQAKAMALWEKKSIQAINIDAHLDLRSIENGITSGSPWFLTLEDKDLQKKLPQLTEFGIQAHCNSETLWAYAKEKKVKIYSLPEIKKPVQELRALLQKLGKKGSTLFSLDIDSVQASQAPGCSAPQTLGFTAAEAIEFCRVAGENRQVKSFGIYECSPPLDLAQATIQLSAHCIYAFLLGREKVLQRKIE